MLTLLVMCEGAAFCRYYIVLDAAGGCAVLSLIAPQGGPVSIPKPSTNTSNNSSSSSQNKSRAATSGTRGSAVGGGAAVGLAGSLMGTSLTIIEPNLVMVQAQVEGKVSKEPKSKHPRHNLYIVPPHACCSGLWCKAYGISSMA